jgi:hypothetical protein
VDVKVAEDVFCAVIPLTVKLYVGVAPPFVGVAVNVIELPAQPELVPAVIAIDTEGVTLLFTVIVIPALVADAGLGHVALDVITHLIISPFTNATPEVPV